MMKDFFAISLFLLFDLLAIILSIVTAFYMRNSLEFFRTAHTLPLENYLTFWPIYIVTLALLTYEGIYTKRYDFWHETRVALKAVFFSMIIVLAYLALSKTIQEYSRAVIVMSFIFMGFFIPLFKRIAKFSLYRMKIWHRPATIFGNDKELTEAIFENPYLGYIENRENPKTVFINSRMMSIDGLRQLIDNQLHKNHEVIFIPILNDFDLTHSQIYELSNARTNLVSLQNRLKSRSRRVVKFVFDIVVSILLLPVLLPVMAVIAWKISQEKSGKKILFEQERLGKDGKSFVCYKFRTMVDNGDEILSEYLKKHPEEQEYYEKFHKYRNDPRVTRIGEFLRKTSLDELPQIFNVLKGEMSLVGPRPYLLDEKEKMGDKFETIVSVRPGITGLWQVSGRSDVDFFDRLDIDVWYIRNWSLWLDIMILFKTVKTVLVREGAY